MRLDLDGEPIHTRTQSVVVRRRADARLEASGSLLDLRTRGFLPVGGSLQGMGIIHHMALRWILDATGRVVEQWLPEQPTVAFDATAETGGESCRDPVARLATLADTPLGSGLSQTLRDRSGGPLGCSHLITLALFMDAAVRAGLARPGPRVDDGPWFRRDLVFAAHETATGSVLVGIRQGDLDWNGTPPPALAPDRFARHHELVARVGVDLWPGSLTTISGAERRRTSEAFTNAGWETRDHLLAALAGIGLARGAAAEILARLGSTPDATPWRDALVMLPPALVQCRAAHPDAWHDKVRATPRHPGLTALPDSCYMWRRDGALERIRSARGAGKGGR
jgi:hypothetical protein